MKPFLYVIYVICNGLEMLYIILFFLYGIERHQ